MPITKSAKKRMRTSELSRLRNKSVKSAIDTVRKKLLDSFAEGDKGKATQIFGQYCSVLDKSLKKGIIKANVADRSKSRMAVRLQKMI